MRRAGWSALAAGALLASLFTVGVSSTGAAPGVADAAVAHNPACGGNAANDVGFADVGSGHGHFAAINCLAHYEITVGTGAGEVSPNDSVTRNQRALFMRRAARVTGARLPDPVSQGLTDIGDYALPVRNAINQMVAAGIMTGSDTLFRPADAVTRAEMALIILNFLAQPGVSDHVDRDPRTGRVTIRDQQRIAIAPDDFFSRVRAVYPRAVDDAVSALYELGVAKGTTATEFAPSASVTRAQMAAFSTRALAFPRPRPAGASIAPAGPRGYVVSVRDAVFAPVRDVRVDVFYAEGDTSRAFDADGTCRQVEGASSKRCEIDASDRMTNAAGDLAFTIPADDGRNVTVWAWTGQIGARVDSGTGLATYAGSAQVPAGGPAWHYKVSLSSPTDVAPLGSVVTVTLQIADVFGVDSAHPDAVYYFNLTANSIHSSGFKTLVWRRTVAVRTDSHGRASFTVGGPLDRLENTPAHADPDVEVSWTVQAARDCIIRTQLCYGLTPFSEQSAAMVTFSEALPTLTSVVASPAAAYVRASDTGRGAGNTIRVTAIDQYGHGVFNSEVLLYSGDYASDVPTVPYHTGRNGTVDIPILRDSSIGAADAVSVTVRHNGVTERPADLVSLLWVTPARSTAAGSGSIMTADLALNEIVVLVGSTPVLISYDLADSFYDRTSGRSPVPVSVGAFEAQLFRHLAEQAEYAADTLFLSWNERGAHPNTIVEWTLSS